MPSNKFTRNKRLRRTPPVCKKPPLPYPPYPYPYPPGEPIDTLDPTTRWAKKHTPPPIPTPPLTAIAIRNLAYHVYPKSNTPALVNNLIQIRRRWDLFNGRRIISVATGPGLLPVDRIIELLGTDAEYFERPNDPRLRDTASFRPMLEILRDLNPNQATFYAHTKGTAELHNGDQPRQLAIARWRNRMYHELLDNWPAVAHELQTHAACGIYKVDVSQLGPNLVHTPCGLPWKNFLYAGTFFWFRHDCIFRNPQWSAIPDDPYANEAWLGSLLRSDQAATIYQVWEPTHFPHLEFYNPHAYDDPIDDIPF